MSTSTFEGYEGGLLVVRRVNWFEDIAVPAVTNRTPAVSLSHQQILTAYRGFEGEPWPDREILNGIRLQNGLASLDQHAIVEEYYGKVSQEYLSDLICIGSPKGFNSLPSLPTAYVFLGYDYGFYLTETGVFSSLFHEVIYGMYPEIRRFSSLLNSCLLLPTIEVAKELELTRNSLLAVGADLEGYEKCYPVAIYGIPK